MRRNFILVVVALALSLPVCAGPVIIGGEDLDWHGNYNNGSGPTQKGWRYIENAIRQMRQPGCITRGNGSIAVLGAPASTLDNGTLNYGGHGGAAMHYAATVAQGIPVQYFDLTAGINNLFANINTINPSILYIPSSFAAGGITPAEQTALNAHAMDIKNFVNNGGGLMAHVDPNSTWLSTVLGSGFSFSSANCNSFGATLTLAGVTAFPTLTNNDINNTAGPCHATFSSFASLQPLATDGGGNVFIIGGGCNTSIGPNFSCSTPVCAGQATSCASVNATGPFSWNFGDGSPVVTTHNSTHIYANPGTYTVTFTSNSGTSTVTHNVVVAPLPPQPVISGSASACGMQTYCVAGVPGVTYNWTITGGMPSAGTGNCITVTWNSTGPYSVFVEAVNAQGCRRRSILNVQPCASTTCCDYNALQASLSSFAAVGGGRYDLTSTITAPSGWLVNRVRAELASTTVMYSPASCGTSGPANSYVTAVSPFAGLPITSTPFPFGREAVWEIASGGGINASGGIPLTFTAQFPPMPTNWFCTDYLSFCIRYEITVIVQTPTGKICRTCSISRCYGPFKRSKWDPSDPPDITSGQPFSYRVKAAASEERVVAPVGRLGLMLKRGTGDARGQLGGGTVAAIKDRAAEFRELVIDRPGQGYVLVLIAEDGTELAESKPFNVRPKP